MLRKNLFLIKIQKLGLVAMHKCTKLFKKFHIKKIIN